MVEANSHLKLLSASILDIYKVFEHIDMLPIGIGIRYHLYTVIHPTWLRFLRFRVICGVRMMSLCRG